MVSDPIQTLPSITDAGSQPEGQQSHYPLSTKTRLLGWESTIGHKEERGVCGVGWGHVFPTRAKAGVGQDVFALGLP